MPLPFRSLHRARFVVAWVLLSSSVLCLGDDPSTAPARATLGRQELLDAATKVRARIADLTVTAEDVVVRGAGEATKRSRKSVIVKGPRVYVNHVYSFNEDGSNAFCREAAFDGARSTIHLPQMASATVRDGQERELQTNGTRFFDINLLNPPREGTRGQDQNLVSLLESADAAVRPDLEEIDGRACHVVDVPMPRSKKRQMTVWIDAGRGMLPMKYVLYVGDEQVAMEFSIEKAAEFADGVWLATRGRVKVFPVLKDARIKEEVETVMTTEVFGADRPAVAVNTHVADDAFDLWKRLPPGTLGADLDAGKNWLTGIPEAAPKK